MPHQQSIRKVVSEISTTNSIAAYLCFVHSLLFNSDLQPLVPSANSYLYCCPSLLVNQEVIKVEERTSEERSSYASEQEKGEIAGRTLAKSGESENDHLR